jgi:predicted SAM-dependent methyltransferase
MKLHLGCGSNYIEGWVNIDLESPAAEVHADLRHPLPYTDGAIDFIFNEHFIEHITLEEGITFLKECRRLLKPGGILRISTPDLRWLIATYMSGKLDEWADVGWVPESSCRMVNGGMRLWGHQFVYDLEELSNSLRKSGFSEIRQMPYRESACSELIGLECRPWHEELIMEAS